MKKNIILFFSIFLLNTIGVLSFAQTTVKKEYNTANALHDYLCTFGLKLIEINKSIGTGKQITKYNKDDINSGERVYGIIETKLDTVNGWIVTSAIVIQSDNLAYVVTIGINDEHTVDTKVYVLFSSISDGIPKEIINDYYDFQSLKSTNNTRSDYTEITLEKITLLIFINEKFYLDSFGLTFTEANKVLYDLDKYQIEY